MAYLPGVNVCMICTSQKFYHIQITIFTGPVQSSISARKILFHHQHFIMEKTKSNNSGDWTFACTSTGKNLNLRRLNGKFMRNRELVVLRALIERQRSFLRLVISLNLKKIIIIIKNHFICRTAAETDLWVLIFNFVHDHLFFSKFIIIYFFVI